MRKIILGLLFSSILSAVIYMVRYVSSEEVAKAAKKNARRSGIKGSKSKRRMRLRA